MSKIRVGTDCSGIEAPIQALRNLRVPHVHVFSSDVDEKCARTAAANFKPLETRVEDITRRDPSDVPSVDLYVCGFPCQPFSHAGSKHGLDDARGTVFRACVEYIAHHRPRYFVLENVKLLLTHDSGHTWNVIRSALEAIPGYAVSWKVVNTADYGVPQSRNRLYIVGVRDAQTPFVFPDGVPTPDPMTLVDRSTKQSAFPPPLREGQAVVARQMSRVLDDRGLPGTFYDVCQFRGPRRVPSHGFPLATCVLTTSYVWCKPMDRWATTGELLAMQGFPTTLKRGEGVTERRFQRQIGNAMSVNVLQAIFRRLLKKK